MRHLLLLIVALVFAVSVSGQNDASPGRLGRTLGELNESQCERCCGEPADSGEYPYPDCRCPLRKKGILAALD